MSAVYQCERGFGSVKSQRGELRDCRLLHQLTQGGDNRFQPISGGIK
ncbi:hypothetical protein LU667_22190 [Pseudomonas kurunegalensis]|nr:hypothetical protein [Pseudomonas kurunegalensis]MCE0939695.1 hypothetical protein [Pseudomonas kurunegalensis]